MSSCISSWSRTIRTSFSPVFDRCLTSLDMENHTPERSGEQGPPEGQSSSWRKAARDAQAKVSTLDVFASYFVLIYSTSRERYIRTSICYRGDLGSIYNNGRSLDNPQRPGAEMENTLTFAINPSANHFRFTETQAQPPIGGVLSPTPNPVRVWDYERLTSLRLSQLGWSSPSSATHITTYPTPTRMFRTTMRRI
jgi:hypothetical protein